MNFFSKKIGMFLKENNLVLASAESCTAGLISSTLAETSGSSAWLAGSVVAYSPKVKNEVLGVSYETIKEKDITSCEVAEEMAKGLSKVMSDANILVSTTGVAGPGGGTDEIPVGTVCFAWFFKNENKIFSQKMLFEGDRNQIREMAMQHSLIKTKELFLLLKNQNTVNSKI